MGSGQSTAESSQQLPKDQNKQNKQIGNLIENFTKSIQMYNKNDMSEIKKFIESHYPNGNKEIIKIINMVDNTLQGQVSSGQNSEKNLYDRFQEINKSNIDSVRTKFVNHDLISGDEKLQNKINNIFDPFVNLRTEAMFYRYKYIQVNVILILLITQFQEIFDTTVSALSSDFLLKINKYKSLLEHFINIAQQLSSESQTLTKQDREDIDKISNEAITKLNEFVVSSKDKIQQLSDETPQLLVKMLLETQQLTIDQINEINEINNKLPANSKQNKTK